jgi:acyl-CoA thioesterase I
MTMADILLPQRILKMLKLLKSLLFTLTMSLLVQKGLAKEAKTENLLVLGDSLSAAYGIPTEQGWVNLLAQQLRDQYPYHVINASVSGETTGGGLARLPKLLQQHQPKWVILQLGANDGLRGHPVDLIQRQLAELITQIQATKAQVLLLGIQIPPNYGAKYAQKFQAIYPSLAQQYSLPLVPFMLEGVAGNASLMQKDGLHPTASAQPIILATVWKHLASQLAPQPLDTPSR